MNNKNKKGFTLIELLVVIAIIGLLAAVAGASMVNARQKARDSRRMVNIKSIKTALELFHEANGRYPRIGGDKVATTIDAIDSVQNNFVCSMVPIYLGARNQDPLNVAPYVYIYYTENGTNYKLRAKMEQGVIREAQEDGGNADDYFEVSSSFAVTDLWELGATSGQPGCS